MKIFVVCAALPPALDGIGDYTARIATKLSANHEITVLTSQESAAPIKNVQIETCFTISDPKSYFNILERVKQGSPDWLILQYNPFSYGKWGKNLILPKVFHAIRKQVPKTKTALMVHEPFVPSANLKWAIMGIWQKWQLRSLGKSSDVIWFSIEPWAIKFRDWFEHVHPSHLPIGSNVDFVETSRGDARMLVGIEPDVFVLGLFGQIHISLMLDRVLKAATKLKNAGRNVAILYIGSNSEGVKSALPGLTVVTTGRLDSGEVSKRLPAIDIFMSPFVDGVSTRRGSMMAALQHGLPVAGTAGINSDQLLLDSAGESLAIAASDSCEQYVVMVANLADRPELRANIGQNAKILYAQNFEWDKICEKMISDLQKTTTYLSIANPMSG